MTEPQAPKPEKKPRNLLKGCAYTIATFVMAFGILYTGHFKIEAWASAIAAVIIGVLVVRLSGINGGWE
jgi:hypothetical protein